MVRFLDRHTSRPVVRIRKGTYGKYRPTRQWRVSEARSCNSQQAVFGLVSARSAPAHTISALPPKADMVRRDRDVRFVPEADIREMTCVKQKGRLARAVVSPMIGNFGPMRIRKSGRPGDEVPTSQDKST